MKILDIGCGNRSPSLTKRWFPQSEYHGVDIQQYNQTEDDLSCMDKYFRVTEDNRGYEEIPNGYYDFVILNHVIEHNRHPLSLLTIAVEKLKLHGVIYIAFPSERSIEFPHAEGTLNFFDDLTHVWLPSLNQIVNTLLALDVRVLSAGRSRDCLRFAGGILMLPFALLRWILTGRLHSRGLWYVFGFEDRVIGMKRASSGDST